MRKIIVNLAVSLDGFIEGPKGEFDWCFTDQDYGMTDFLESIDTILMGRKSFETFIKASPDLFNDKHIIVFSGSLLDSPKSNISISRDFHITIEDLKNTPGKNIWFFGGAELLNSFLENNLIDSISLAVHPILLGCGKKLFVNQHNNLKLELCGLVQYDSGLVQLNYNLKY